MRESVREDCFFEYESKRDMIQFANNKDWKELSGIQVGECIGKGEKPPFILSEDIEIWQQLLKNEEGGAYELRLVSDRGEIIWCRLKTSVVFQEGKNYRLVGCVSDISQDMKEKEQEQFMNRLDPLTKVFDKENVQAEVDSYLKALGENGIHAMLIIDIDDLKSINTSLGYLFGDTVIANLSEAFRESVPEDSIIGRVGGDKFVIFLKNASAMERVLEIVEGIRTALWGVYAGENKELRITCCIGIAKYPLHGRDYQSLFENADKALYQAKEKGKNTVQLYNQTLLHCLPEKETSYYNRYKMHDGQTLSKNGKQEIIDFTFDIMAKTKDVNSAIKLLLEKVGREYHVDNVGILETEKDGTCLELVYEWHTKNSESFCHEVSVDENCLTHGDCFDSKGLHIEEKEEQSIMMAAFYEEGRFRGCVCLKDTSGVRRWSEEEKENLIEISKIISFYLLKLRVSEKITERLEYIRNYDAMTELPTLYKFRQDALELVEKRPQKYAVIYWDISNFKFINDTYGYQAGDRVLYDLAEHLRNCLDREACLVARDCADKFVGLCPAGDTEELKSWVNKTCQDFHEMQKEKNISVNLTLVSGVYILEKGNLDVSTAVDNANVARKAAKGGMSNACKFYDEKMEETIRREIEILNNMEEALKNREFVVYFQPKISLDEERPAGAEALVRWRRFDGSMVSPGDFIPLFERNGFILQLDFFVYEEVCRTIRWWLDNNMKTVPISVNVSRVHLNDKEFISKLKSLVDYYQVPPELLELELTESMFLSDTKAALSTMQDLRKMGFSVSIDDFGAGYSSLSLLKDMTTDVIKLDKEFFVHGEMLNEEKIVVSSIINMAKKLNMKVLSEGIETKNQTEFLKEMDCDLVQGFFYAKPMPIEDFERFLNH